MFLTQPPVQFGALPGPLVFCCFSLVQCIGFTVIPWESLSRRLIGVLEPAASARGVQQFEDLLRHLEFVVVAAAHRVQSIGVFSISWEAVTTSLIEVLDSTAG